MNIATLMYHDVVANSRWDDSGFPGAAAAHYKFDETDFARHLAALAAHDLRFPSVTECASGPGVCLLTFDDGGSSAMRVAKALDARGMTGHFLITTGRIGTDGFVSASDVVALRDAGHVIGSHSHTHPAEISRLDVAALNAQWHDSVDRLAQLLGAAVTVASIPGGFYSRAVAASAAAAGIRHLFTSEPITRVQQLGDCRILGRYALWRGMAPGQAAALALGTGTPRQRQWLAWNTKKPLKRWSRPLYHRLRAQLRGD